MIYDLRLAIGARPLTPGAWRLAIYSLMCAGAITCSPSALAQAAPKRAKPPEAATTKQTTKPAGKNASARSVAPSSTAPQLIDLPTALRLAGAQNLDVQIARQKLGEARANHAMVREQFFPWLMPGLAYQRDDGQIQDVTGNIFNVSRQSYSVGTTVAAELELGETYFKELVSRQLVRAADHSLQAQQQQSVFAAGAQYFELARARAAAEVAREAIRISTDYERQLQQVVEIGRAFKGDLLRVQVQTGQEQLALRRALEQQRLAAARLAQTLRLDATVELVAADTDPLPLTLVATNHALDSLVAQALNARPELRQSQALIAAARSEKQGVTYGPLVPTVGAQMFFGGLGGGFNSDFGNFGDREHYQLLLGWRLGPGGLFDKPRIQASAARLEGARLQAEKLQDEIVRQVVEAFTRSQSLRDQMTTALRTLAAAEETLRLSRERKEFGVGIVLEFIQAGQELTRARNDYLNTVAEHNQAQFSLYTALGQPASDALSGTKGQPPATPVPPKK